MPKLLVSLSQTVIKFSFYLLFFLVPLIFTPFNYELFEYNKMMTTYGITAFIGSFWLIKMVAERKIKIARTPLDIPIVLFLISQIVSTIFSIDQHVSIWGYYSRFNGALLSTVAYIILYYAFVSNFPKEKISKLISVIIFSGAIVSVYAIFEHFGASPSCLFITGKFNVDCWVQDVQNRVYATLGQPNWLAAYLAILIPISLGIGLQNLIRRNYWIIGFIFYLGLIFTKSRSGFIGFIVSNVLFWTMLLFKYKKIIVKPLLIVNSLFIILVFFSSSPFQQINRFTFQELTKHYQQSTINLPSQAGNQRSAINSPGSSVIDVGITESGKIRNIVWRGAIDIFKNYPFFGTGVETFAFAYYKYRPVEHNMTSEWDFLYNKAHNEYLNYAATTGSFGLGSYLLLIIFYVFWFIKTILKFKAPNIKQAPNSKHQISNKHQIQSTKYQTNKFGVWDFDHLNLFGIWDLGFGILILALFCSWSSILFTNFFGFSVVLVQLFFYLIPAVSFVLLRAENQTEQTKEVFSPFSVIQMIFTAFIVFFLLYLLFSLSHLWYADTLYATGYNEMKAGNFSSSYESLRQALLIRFDEPMYYDEFSYPTALLSVAYAEEKQSTLSAKYRDQAILASDMAVTISPSNVNFWKTRTRMFYVLAASDEKYLDDAVKSLEIAHELAPTDPKISYNLGIFYDQFGKKEESLKLLEEAARFKPDYKDVFLALGLFYQRDKNYAKAKEMFNYILTKIDPDDKIAKEKLEEMK